MTLSIPSSPAVGQRVTMEGATFVWTGSVWVVDPFGLRFASQTQAEAGTAEDVAMTPLRARQARDVFDNALPSSNVCRAWWLFSDQSPYSIIGQANIASVLRVSNARYRLTFATPRPNANYLVLGSVDPGGLSPNNHPVVALTPIPSTFLPESFEVVTGPTGGQGSTGGFLIETRAVSVVVFQ